jgi:RecB family endonuclease NucS
MESLLSSLWEKQQSILKAFYSCLKNDDSEDQTKAIILAEPQLIKSDVQSLKGEKDVSPTAIGIGSIKEMVKIPKSNQSRNSNRNYKWNKEMG